MNADRFEALLTELDGNSLETLMKKNAKYGTEDRLHNFNAGGQIFGGTAAQACWGYLTKHLVALRDMIEKDDFSDREDFLEKCQDSINYIRFIWCIGNERNEQARSITGAEYQRHAMRTANAETAQELILNGVMGLNGEAGEVIDIYKKHLFQGHVMDSEKMVDELSDVLWYLAITAEGLGVTLDDIALHNVEKLRKRYPDGFDAKRSVHREESK